MSWVEMAACRGRTDIDWFAEDGRRYRRLEDARALCATCEVQGECLAEALAEGRYQYGFRAGYTAAERLRMPRPRLYAIAASCGTDAGYYRHIRRDGEPACDACREAHNAAARVRKVNA